MKYIKKIFETLIVRKHSIGQIQRAFVDKMSGFDLNEIESFIQLVSDESDSISYITLSVTINKDFSRPVHSIKSSEYNTDSRVNISESDPIYDYNNKFNKGITINTIKRELGVRFQPTMDALLMNDNGFLYFEISCVPLDKNALIELRGTIDDKNEYSDMFYIGQETNFSFKDMFTIKILRKSDYEKFIK